MDGPASDVIDLSVVIPAHDERDNLAPLFAELLPALEATGHRFEVIVVDDGSDDGTGNELLAHARREPRIRPVLLAQRAGQSAALAAGLSRARGSILVTLDADLQNDPADLGRLLDALGAADVVSGIRAHRHDRWIRRAASRIANGARRAALGDSITDIGCSFKAYRREAIDGLPMFVGVHRFLPALAAFRGARVVEIALSHRPRRHGVSKYGVSDRLWRGLYDLIGVRWLKSRLIPPSPRKVDP